MSLSLYDFVASQRAAFCAARDAVSAAVSSSEGGIWGVSDPLCHPPVEVQALEKRGSLTPQMYVVVVRQNRAAVRDITECAAGVTFGEFIGKNTPDRFCRKIAFI